MDTKTVLITGASKGIGRATALHLDRIGYRVFAGVRQASDAESLCSEASSRLTPLILDVTRADQIETAMTQIARAAGGNLDVLINNAGIAIAAPLEYLPLDEFRRQIEVNLTGQLALIQAALPMLRQTRGRIINVTSIGGRLAGKMLGAYHASKFALEAVTDTLRQELREWGIDVIAVQPGEIATPIWETSSSTAQRLFSRMSPRLQEHYGALIAATTARASKSAQTGLAPERVAEVIGTAVSARRPKTRYLVGMDAKIGGRLIAFLPDRVRDRMMAARS